MTNHFMRSFIIPIIVSFSVLASCSRQAPESKYDINCPVRSVTVHASKGEFDHVLHFDRKGAVRRIDYFNPDGSFRYRREYVCDSLKRPVTVYQFNASGESEARYEYIYDGPFLAEHTIYGMNNQDVSRWKYSNDGEKITGLEYYCEGMLEYVICKSYFDGMCTEISLDPETGDTLSVAISKSFSEGKVMYVKSESMDLSVEYGDNGLPLSAHCARLDSECGLLWDESLEDHPDRLYSYMFDSHGNWTQRVEMTLPDSTEFSRITRKIRY